ncbi:MAG: hypothetical protein Q8K66_04140 [Sediminibacterium sp.]|nr:hypothetical protein [Sediminibacterium sp.]MDP3128129.1 hypothetical protein [Sediminibacterium sp.]
MNVSQPYRTHLNRDFMEGLYKLIELMLQQSPLYDIDRMHLAVLGRIKDRIYQKMGLYKREYTMTFSPEEAIALRVLYTDYVKEHLTNIGNRLHVISNEVHRQYCQ